MYNELKAKSTFTNEIDSQDINGNYISDPLYLYQPIRRCGNDIYFMADVDHYSQLALMQLLTDIQTDIISKNAINILNGQCQDAIRLHICSYGGYLSAGLALYDFIKNMQVTTIGIVEGVCMSAATLLLLACDRRQMSENSVILIHQLSGGMWGTYKNMKDSMINADKAMSKLKTIYLNETSIGITEKMSEKLHSFGDDLLGMEKYFDEIEDERLDDLEELLNRDLELSYDECESLGLIDSEEEREQVMLTEEDQEAIKDYIQKIAKKRLAQNKREEVEASKPKSQKQTTKKSTKKGKNK